MEKLDTLVNREQLKMLTGIDFDSLSSSWFSIDEMSKKSIKLSLKEIENSEKFNKIRSFDERFDNKSPIKVALDSLEENGLPNWLIMEICAQKSNSVRTDGAVGLFGKYSFLKKLVPNKHLEVVYRRLENVSEYFNTYGKMS